MALGNKQPKFEGDTSASIETGVDAAASTKVAEYRGFVNVSELFQDKLPPIKLGGLPTLKAKGGFIVDNQNVNAGNNVVLDMVSYNYKWVLSPGTEGDEAAKLLRTSYDGKTLEGTGQTCDAYLTFLKSEGYNDAKLTQRLEVVGILMEAATPNYARVNDMVLVDMAPTSVGSFEGQLIQAGVKISRGIMKQGDAGKLRFSIAAKTSKGKTWSALEVTGA